MCVCVFLYDCIVAMANLVFGLKLLALPRFKQLKEQEARRRQQREEEKKKAEEAAANVTQTNGAHEKEAISVQGESGDEVESSDSKNGSPNSLTGMTNSSSTDYRVVNGNLSNLDSKEDQRTSGLLLNRVVVSNFYSLCFICIMLPYFLVGFICMVIT